MEGNWARSASAPAHRLFAKGDIGFWDANYRTRFGEIDIIAEKKPHIIFCRGENAWSAGNRFSHGGGLRP